MNHVISQQDSKGVITNDIFGTENSMPQTQCFLLTYIETVYAFRENIFNGFKQLVFSGLFQLVFKLEVFIKMILNRAFREVANKNIPSSSPRRRGTTTVVDSRLRGNDGELVFSVLPLPLVHEVTKIRSVVPAAMASSTAYWIRGLSTTGSIYLGHALVAGRKRVPIPATGNTGFLTILVITKQDIKLGAKVCLTCILRTGQESARLKKV